MSRWTEFDSRPRGVHVSRPDLDPGEEIIAEIVAQGTWVGPIPGWRWWRLTVGSLILTDRRLIFEPDQLWSFGLGRRWEAPLGDLEGARWLRPLEGGPPARLADRLVLYLSDGSEELFAFFIRNNIRDYLASLQQTMVRVRLAADQDASSWETPRDDDVDHIHDKQFFLHRPWAMALMVLLLVLCLVALAITVYERSSI